MNVLMRPGPNKTLHALVQTKINESEKFIAGIYFQSEALSSNL